MPDTTRYNGIDMANIASINGQDVPSGGGGYTSSSTGLLTWGYDGTPTRPHPAKAYTGGSTPQSFDQFNGISSYPVVAVEHTLYHTAVLDSNGDVYTGGGANASQLGRSSANPLDEYHQASITNVASLAGHSGGWLAVKNDGTLWYTGSSANFVGSNINYAWAQYGTDTDWVDAKSQPNYAYFIILLKGSVGSYKAYSCGYNAYGVTGQGTTSGTTNAPTRVKVSAGVDFDENIAAFDVGLNCCICTTTSGKLFSWGDGNYGQHGNGSSTDLLYATQSGTDTDWAVPNVGAGWVGCIKTNGTFYRSTSNTFYTLWASSSHVSRQWVQVGTDTDWQEVHGFRPLGNPHSTPSIIAKKGGVWVINMKNTTGWNGAKSETAVGGANTFYDMTSSANLETPLPSSGTINFMGYMCDLWNTQLPIGFMFSVS